MIKFCSHCGNKKAEEFLQENLSDAQYEQKAERDFEEDTKMLSGDIKNFFTYLEKGDETEAKHQIDAIHKKLQRLLKK
jgi:hypothetical protein